MPSLARQAIIVYAIAVAAIVLLELFHVGDNTTMIGHVMILATTALNIINSHQNGKRLEEVHRALNGKKEEEPHA